MNFENIFSVLAPLFIGGFIVHYIHVLWERKSSQLKKKQEFKETRYKCIIMLMLSLLDFEKNKQMLHLHGREYINKKEDLIYDLKLELSNMILFASEEVIIKMKDFIQNPSQESFYKVAIGMRQDLWGGKISLVKLENFILSEEKN
ncbi:MAG: hypothetical protein JW715_15685 [Sedimentisphaerales bacterium]|nr:hypothetical protein [Sedimentisphaerales bacterium]